MLIFCFAIVISNCFQPRTPLLISKSAPGFSDTELLNIFPDKNKENRAMWKIIFYIQKSTTTFSYDRPLADKLILENIRGFMVYGKSSRIYLLLRSNREQLRKIQQVSAALQQESTSCWLPVTDMRRERTWRSFIR